MLSKSRVREILRNPKLTDEEVERLRDDMYTWAEVIVDVLESGKRFQQPPVGIDTPNQKSDHER